MPRHLITRIDLSKIYPPFLEKYLELLAKCESRGAYYYAVSGFRDPKEQDDKYAQGRTKPGPRITNAPGGFSAHNYGIAADCARDEDLVKVGLQTSWGADGYDVLAHEGEPLGLQVGVPGLTDPGHVQLPLAQKLKRKERSILLELRGLYLKGGLPAVWAQLDAWGFAA